MSKSDYKWLILNDPTANNLSRKGASAEVIACALAQEKKILENRIFELEMIVPRKIKLPDGKVIIWHCPDEHVPLMADPTT